MTSVLAELAGREPSSERVHPRSVECVICGYRADMPSECLSDNWQRMMCEHCGAPIEFCGLAFGVHPREDYEVHTRLDASKIASALTKAQTAALLAMNPQERHWSPAAMIPAAGATMMSLNDLWRGKRGVLPPIQLVSWMRNDWSGQRVWTMTDHGREVAHASLLASKPS